MVRGLFITGTDTNVGKTVVSAALMQRFRSQVAVRYRKPIQTGIERDDDTSEVTKLGACKPGEIRAEGIRLREPVSPHLAARRAGVSIDIEALADALSAEPDTSRWIVEGAGGVLVPITDTDLMVDLMVLLAMPVLVVGRSTLGTINHTLLTIEALRARGLRAIAAVLVGPFDAENKQAVEHHGRIRVVGDLPRLEPLTTAALGSWAATGLDPDGRLLDALR